MKKSPAFKMVLRFIAILTLVVFGSIFLEDGREEREMDRGKKLMRPRVLQEAVEEAERDLLNASSPNERAVAQSKFEAALAARDRADAE